MKRLGFCIIISLFITATQAEKGMWLPYLLKQLNEKEMQLKGMKITAEDIYNINQGSLKDAVILFGRGCTGEIVSEQGLFITNHHCGYGSIQAQSSLENDYLTHGFWAMKPDEELPIPGLTVTRLVYMKDVTNEILTGVSLDNMSEVERGKIVKENTDKIIKEATDGTHYTALVKAIYGGNQYLLFVNEIFKDIRLVGAPPSSIGKFGGDTDNWMWPRHTGDFALFRIYCGEDGKPADYSKNNKPYKPLKHVSISIKGIEENDFTFIIGYPGSTQQFITSWAVNMVQNHINPIAIDLRTQRLDIIKRYMSADPLTRIQYSAKTASIANGWKKWIGENKGLIRLEVIEEKRNLEKDFTQWINQNNVRKTKYEGLLPSFEKFYANYTPFSATAAYFRESIINIELLNFAMNFAGLTSESQKNPTMDANDLEKLRNRYINFSNNFYKNYNAQLDKEIFILLITAYYNQVDPSTLPEETKKIIKKYKGNFSKMAEDVYAKSLFVNKEKLLAFLNNYKPSQYKTIEKDLAFALIHPLRIQYVTETQPQLIAMRNSIDSLERVWIDALIQMQSDKVFHPDADLTMRITYGNVAGYYPSDGAKYLHYTTLDGVMEKESMGNYDYAVDSMLKKLHKNKDYGMYANEKGEMPVAFIATNHTTGGNSGSPVFNAEGQLIGINFDRCWEGTMSDIQYDPDLCRNISVDIRYVLFIIDKLAGAKHLIDEMTIVK